MFDVENNRYAFVGTVNDPSRSQFVAKQSLQKTKDPCTKEQKLSVRKGRGKILCKENGTTGKRKKGTEKVRKRDRKHWRIM